MRVNPKTGWVEQSEAEIILQSRLIREIPNVSFMVEEKDDHFKIVITWATFSAFKLPGIEVLRMNLRFDFVNDEAFDLTSFVLQSIASHEQYSTAGNGIFCRRKGTEE